MSNKIFKTGIYARLSREDADRIESNSIQSQRAICLAYIESHDDLELVDTYIDDGETGSNTDRPGFQRMLQDMRSGRIDCAVSKDLSRFSRNYIDAGNYLEKIFPAMGIRYIAINDNYDSMAPGSGSDVITLPFKNLVNDIYCRDISVKIRSSLEVKRKHPFDRYAQEPVLCLDEFRSSLLIGDMLDYLDGYPINLPARYAPRVACYETVYLISNIDLKEQYPNIQAIEPETWKAFLRRIHHVIEYQKDGPPIDHGPALNYIYPAPPKVPDWVAEAEEAEQKELW